MNRGTVDNQEAGMSYTHLGDAQLVYVPEMDPVVNPGSVPGRLLGNGTGRIEGPHLNGELRWSFFEEDCDWDPGILDAGRIPDQDLGRSVCRTYPRGVLETDDGAVIQFEAQGFALRRENDPIWAVGSTVRFVTDSDAYQWLTNLLVAYDGTFNEQNGTATWSFHARDALIPRKGDRVPSTG